MHRMPPGRVQIRNNTVVSNGDVLRGAPVWIYCSGKKSGATAYATDPSYYRQLQEAGLNAVRVVCFDPWQRSHGYPYWDLDTASERTEFLAELDRAVEIATEHHFQVMINYHDVGESDLPHLLEFWEWVAPRYASHTNVFYELVNEPVAWSTVEFTEKVINDQQLIYKRVRELAPETHLVMLSFAQIESPHSDFSPVDVASRLTDVDWSNASVGFHPYGVLSSTTILRIREAFPVLNTEMDLPSGYGGEDETTLIDGELYGIQTMERLGISWFAWSVDGQEKFERLFTGGVLVDAANKDYIWKRPVLPGITRKGRSAVAQFFREFPVGRAVDVMGMKSGHVALFLVLSCTVALLDGLMLAMLIPISYGLAEGSFTFLSNWPVLGWLMSNSSALSGNYALMFLALATLTFLIGVARGLLGYCLHLTVAHYYGQYSIQLSSYLLSRYLSFGKAYFDRHSTGNLAAVIDHHHDLLNLFQGLLRALTESFTLLAYIAVLLFISWRLTLVVLLVFPPVYLIRRWITGRIRRPGEEAHGDSMSIAAQLYRVLAAIPLYQSFSREASALESYRATAERLRKANVKVWIYRGLIHPIQDISILLALLIILSLAFVVEDGGTRQVASLFVFFFVARLALPRLTAFHEIELEFEEKLPGVRPMFEVFDDEEKYFVRGGTAVFSGLTRGIEFRQLSFSYPAGPRVLDEISFSIPKGQMTALVGPSGSGKTTLTSLLLRYYDIPPGQLFIDEHDIHHFSIESLRRHLALVSQNVELLSDSLRNNLQFGLQEEASDRVLNEVIKESGLQDMVDAFPSGLDTKLGERGLTMSGGQRQRIAIARALLRHAPVLILDEATSSLDSRTERQVQNAIENAVKGCTSLVIAHRLSTIQRADQVVVLGKGRVVEQGSLKELISGRGLFYSMWEAQKFD
ncbi:ATP-binding cassette domain-containing protein [Pseudomonadota bacterium]